MSQGPGAGGPVGRRAVFLDRDGVINEDSGFVTRPEDFVFRPGAIESLAEIQRLGYLLIVVTNQSGIGRRLYTDEDYARVTQHMLAQLASSGVRMDGVYHCPHSPDDGCSCRKPAPGLIQKAAQEHQIDLGRSWLVGDKQIDIAAADRAGIRKTLLIRSPYPVDPTGAKPLFVGDSLAAIMPPLRREVEAGDPA